MYFLGTQTRQGSQTRVGYAGWCTKGIGGCEGFAEGPQRNLEPRAVTPDAPWPAKNTVWGPSTGSQVSKSSKFRNYSTHRRNPERNSAVQKEDPQGNAQGP